MNSRAAITFFAFRLDLQQLQHGALAATDEEFFIAHAQARPATRLDGVSSGVALINFKPLPRNCV